MKTAPIHRNAEIGALSLIANDPDILGCQVWHSDYFALEDHRSIFDAIQRVYQRTNDCDEFSTISELESMGVLEKLGGRDAVMDILSAHTIKKSDIGREMAEEYRRQLVRYRGYRDSLVLMQEYEPKIRRGTADISEFAEKLSATQRDRNATLSTAKDIAHKLVDQMEGKLDRPCFPTGLIYLDRNMKGGMHGGELLTVASESGGGKSIFMVQAALANLIEGKSVLFFSLEMDKTDIFERMVASTASLPIRSPEEYKTTHKNEIPLISKAIMKLKSKSLIIVDDITDLSSIIAESERLNMLGKADVIVVDYLQIVESSDADSREQQVSDIARKLKNLATKLKVPIITGSQLNDDGKVRESRAIKQHSNQLILIKHSEKKSVVFVDKNRRGARNYSFQIEMDGEISKLKEA
jgi:replicative DNA helicase